MTVLTDEEVDKLFKACASVAVCYPHGTNDPISLYLSLPMADNSFQMRARLYRSWLKVAHEYPLPLDRQTTEEFINRYAAK